MTSDSVDHLVFLIFCLFIVGSHACRYVIYAYTANIIAYFLVCTQLLCVSIYHLMYVLFLIVYIVICLMGCCVELSLLPKEQQLGMGQGDLIC